MIQTKLNVLQDFNTANKCTVVERLLNTVPQADSIALLEDFNIKKKLIMNILSLDILTHKYNYLIDANKDSFIRSLFEFSPKNGYLLGTSEHIPLKNPKTILYQKLKADFPHLIIKLERKEQAAYRDNKLVIFLVKCKLIKPNGKRFRIIFHIDHLSYEEIVEKIKRAENEEE